MAIFDRYAGVYDCLYEDKDYSSECDFLESIFAKYAHGPVRGVLDFGCGTGGHATILGSRGYRVHAVDRSPEMLCIAQSKAVPEGVSFHLGDFRDYDIGKPVDAVLAMFAVMSYMTTNEDIEKALQTAAKHLRAGGLFVFDSWFGPAVFRYPPQEKIKEALSGDRRVIRLTRPRLDITRQVVAVDFKLLVLRGNCLEDEFHEVHEMRPLFMQEVTHLGQRSGFEMIEACPFMCLGSSLSLETWNACFILRHV